MFIRTITLIFCIATIVACAIAAYDLPGWYEMALNMKVIISLIAGIAFMMLVFLVLVSDQKVSSIQRRQMHHDRFN